MQTFLPFKNFNRSASSLDSRRLNKQLLEGRQIYSIISTNKTSGAWANHPAVKMWRNFDNALYLYLVAMRDECIKRGIATDKNWDAITKMHNGNWFRGSGIVMPPWLGDERLHVSHKQNLYVKDPIHYVDFWYVENEKIRCCEKCNYFWPTHTDDYAREFEGYIVV